MMRLKSLIILALLPALFGCSWFRKQDVVTEPRDFIVNVKNTLFNQPTESDPSMAGLGTPSVTITIITEDSSRNEIENEAVLTQEGIDTAADYTRVSITIEGEFIRVEAESGTLFVELNEDNYNLTPDIEWPYYGWTAFANVEKVKLGFSLNRSDPAASTLRLLICPRGGSTPEVLVDSGPQTGSGLTDRGAALVSKQISFTLTPAENPAGLSYDVYTLVVEKNLAVTYNPAITFEATYETNPWSDRWTYEEITSTGKNIGGETYVLQRLTTGGPWNITDPMGDGFDSGLIDLTTSADETITDKYLLLAYILHYGTLSVPVDVYCIDIE